MGYCVFFTRAVPDMWRHTMTAQVDPGNRDDTPGADQYKRCPCLCDIATCAYRCHLGAGHPVPMQGNYNHLCETHHVRPVQR